MTNTAKIIQWVKENSPNDNYNEMLIDFLTVQKDTQKVVEAIEAGKLELQAGNYGYGVQIYDEDNQLDN